MIRINKGVNNIFALTLTEATTIENVEYLFKFTMQQSKEEFFIILNDTSSFKSRYNLFSLLEGTDLTFEDYGDYLYNVYEQDLGSGNLNPAGLNQVEEGRMLVVNNSAEENSYSYNIIENIYEQ